MIISGGQGRRFGGGAPCRWTLALDTQTVLLLREPRARQILDHGEARQYVSADWSGEPVKPRYVSHQFAVKVKASGLPCRCASTTCVTARSEAGSIPASRRICQTIETPKRPSPP